MITDNQVRKLMKLLEQGETMEQASAKCGMDVKSALRKGLNCYNLFVQQS